MNYYPMLINLKGKRCVVVGGGRVAERKIASLLQCEAQIIVVSPEATSKIQHWVSESKIIWLKKDFEPNDLEDAVLVVAATNHTHVNLHVYQSLFTNQWINIVDHPDLCTFIVPATVRKGDLTISISTQGQYPGLSKSLRQKINAWLGDDYEEYLEFLSQMRKKVNELHLQSSVKRGILRALLDDSYLDWTKKKQYSKREQAVELLINTFTT